MSEVTAAGKKEIREFILANWKYVSIRDDEDTELVRLENGVDDEISTVSNGDVNPIIIRAVLTTDTDGIALTDIVGGIKLFKVAEDGDSLLDTSISNFEFTSDDDQLTINQTIEVPEIIE